MKLDLGKDQSIEAKKEVGAGGDFSSCQYQN